ncbi:MAG: hypothetical protein PVH87_18430, partial [Desulfobacteraceae bacterium]
PQSFTPGGICFNTCRILSGILPTFVSSLALALTSFLKAKMAERNFESLLAEHGDIAPHPGLHSRDGCHCKNDAMVEFTFCGPAY